MEEKKMQGGFLPSLLAIRVPGTMYTRVPLHMHTTLQLWQLSAPAPSTKTRPEEWEMEGKDKEKSGEITG